MFHNLRSTCLPTNRKESRFEKFVNPTHWISLRQVLTSGKHPSNERKQKKKRCEWKVPKPESGKIDLLHKSRVACRPCKIYIVDRLPGVVMVVFAICTTESRKFPTHRHRTTQRQRTSSRDCVGRSAERQTQRQTNGHKNINREG